MSAVGVLRVVDGRQVVEYRAYEYSDYTTAALAGQLSLAVTGQITTGHYHQRVLAMQRAYAAVGAGADKVLRKLWPLLSFVLVQLPDANLDAAQQQAGHALEGEVMYFFFYRHGAIGAATDDFKRRHVEIDVRV